jgi:putative SOS response-associated peptidase YedK
MCGRYSLTAVPTRVEAFLGASDGAVLRPRYNVAPGQDVPVAVAGPAGRRALVLRRWGLVPRFARDPAAGARSANARVETAAEHPAFREAFRARRCLVPADGFYEWRRRRGGAEPHHVTLPDGALFAMAGLWERFEPPDGPALETCAVLTGPARGRVRELHARAPILVAPGRLRRLARPRRPRPGAAARAPLQPARRVALVPRGRPARERPALRRARLPRAGAAALAALTRGARRRRAAASQPCAPPLAALRAPWPSASAR